MAHLRQVNDSRIRQLAETLKRNGLAGSESEAVRMATSMTQTEDRVMNHFDQHKQTAVMQTRFSKAPPNTPPTQAPTFREKEVVVQEEPVNRAKPAPLHENGAIHQAISAVKHAYGNVPKADVDIDVKKPLAQVHQEQEHTQSVVANPLPKEEPPAPSQPVAEESQAPVSGASSSQTTQQQQPQAAEKKDTSKFAESKVSLANVFDFSKK